MAGKVLGKHGLWWIRAGVFLIVFASLPGNLYTFEPRVRTFDTASVQIISHKFFFYLTVNKKLVLADAFCCLRIFRCYNLPTTNSHFKDKFK